MRQSEARYAQNAAAPFSFKYHGVVPQVPALRAGGSAAEGIAEITAERKKIHAVEVMPAARRERSDVVRSRSSTGSKAVPAQWCARNSRQSFAIADAAAASQRLPAPSRKPRSDAPSTHKNLKCDALLQIRAEPNRAHKRGSGSGERRASWKNKPPNSCGMADFSLTTQNA
jgi:hypothetical protein